MIQCHAPDVLFYLTVPVEVAVQRNEARIKKGKESEEFSKNKDMQKIRDLKLQSKSKSFTE